MALTISELSIETGGAAVTAPSASTSPPALEPLGVILPTPTPAPVDNIAAKISNVTNLYQLMDLLDDPEVAAKLLNTPKFLVPVDIKELQVISPPTHSFCYKVLKKKQGYYIVPYNGAFYYYKISSPVQLNPYLYAFSFPKHKTAREGFVIIGSDTYHVTYGDLSRNLIRVSRKLNIVRTGLTFDDFVSGSYKLKRSPSKRSSPVAPSDNPSITGKNSSIPADQLKGLISDASIQDLRTSNPTELEELEAANLLSRHQESELLYNLAEEEDEGWESCEVP